MLEPRRRSLTSHFIIARGGARTTAPPHDERRRRIREVGETGAQSGRRARVDSTSVAAARWCSSAAAYLAAGRCGFELCRGAAGQRRQVEIRRQSRGSGSNT
jgi:hypothetical protein